MGEKIDLSIIEAGGAAALADAQKGLEKSTPVISAESTPDTSDAATVAVVAEMDKKLAKSKSVRRRETKGKNVEEKKVKKSVVLSAPEAVESKSEQDIEKEFLAYKDSWLKKVADMKSVEDFLQGRTEGDIFNHITGVLQENFHRILNSGPDGIRKKLKHLDDQFFPFIKEIDTAYGEKKFILQKDFAKDSEPENERRAMEKLVEYKENLIRTMEAVTSIEDFRSTFPDFTKNAIRREYLDDIFSEYKLDTDQEKNNIRRRVAILIMPDLYAAYDKREKELKEAAEAEKAEEKLKNSDEWTVEKLLNKIPNGTIFSVRKADGNVKTFRRDGDRFVTTAKKPAKANAVVLRILTHGGELVAENKSDQAVEMAPLVTDAPKTENTAEDVLIGVEAPVVGEPLPEKSEALASQGIDYLKAEVAKARARWVETDVKNITAWKKFKSLFGIEKDTKKDDAQIEYEKTLKELQNAEMDMMRKGMAEDGMTLSPQDIQEGAERLLRYFKLDEAVNLINERTQYKAQNQSFSEKIIDSLGALGRQYNSIPFKRKMMYAGIFAGLGIAGTLSGGAAAGALASVIVARRVAAGLGTAVATEAGLEKLGDWKRSSKAEKEIKEQIVSISASHNEGEEKKLTAQEVNKEYLSYQDADMSEEEKQRALEYKGSEGNTEKYSGALLEIFNTYGKRAVEEKVQTMRALCLSELEKLDILPTPYAFSKTWGMWDIAKQYYFFTHPEENNPKYSLANPFEDSQKTDEIVNRHIGWEVYALYHNGNDEFLSHVNPDNVEAIKAYLSRPAKENETLSSKELAELGQLLRSSQGEFSPVEKVKSTETEKEKQEKYLKNLSEILGKDIELLNTKLQSEKRAKTWRKLGAIGVGGLVGSGWLTQFAMNHLGGHVAVDWAKEHIGSIFEGNHPIVPNSVDQSTPFRPLTPPLVEMPASVLSDMTGTIEQPHMDATSQDALTSTSPAVEVSVPQPDSVYDFVNQDIVVEKGDSVWKIAGGLADELGLADAQRTHFIDALKDQYGDVRLKAGETINFSEHGIDKDFVENALAHAKGLTEGQMASIDANDVKIAEFASSHPLVTLTNESVDNILHGNTADVVSPQPGMNGSGIADLAQSYDGAIEGEAGEVGATLVDTERGNVRSADIQYDRDIVLGKTYNLREYVDYFNQHPETFIQFQKIDGDYKKFISLGNINDFQEMKGETIRNLDNLKETPLGKFIEMSRKTYGAKLGMPSAKEKVYEYVTRMAMLGIEHPKGVIRLPQSI